MILRRLAAALLLAPTGIAQAQDFKEGSVAPISVEVDGPSIPVGSPITIRGHTVARDAAKPISISVAWLRSLQPGSATARPALARLVAPYQADGSYSVVHQPPVEGRYRVVAISPDGSGRDSVEFDVISGAQSSSAAVDELETGRGLASDVVDEIARIIQDQPPSPAQRDALEHLPPLRQALANRNDAIVQYRGALKLYQQIAEQNPGLAVAFGPGYRQLRDFQRESAQLIPELKGVLAESRKSNIVCDQLIVVQEGFKLASVMFGLANGFKTAVGFFLEKSPYTGPISTLSFKAKALAFAGGKAVDGLPGLAAKVSGVIASTLFDHYCERFEGPIKGITKVEYYSNGEMWWRYTVELEGQMTLAYRKGSDLKKGVALKGHIVGTGTRFAVMDQALRVLKRKALAGGVIVGSTIPPVGFPYTSVPGAMALQAVPTAFFIPVDGQFINGKLKLQLGPSRTDFNETYTLARGKYVVGGPLSMGVLHFVHYEIAFDKARGIIDKATGADAGPIEIPVQMGKDQMIAERVFTAARGKVLAKGNYDVKIKVCNPKC